MLWKRIIKNSARTARLEFQNLLSKSIFSTVHYEILHEPVILQHSGAGFDNAQKANWLYDEFHKVENHYEHHILFSDGVEMQIPFVFFFHRTQSWFEE
jgi:hypothetical protein